MEQLKPIRTFLEVARQQSFSGAARSLGMTPASVTRIVAALEKDLGKQLLLRTTRQVSLTAEGAIIAARYRPVIEEFDAIGRELTQRRDAGRLRVNAPLSLGLRILPEVVAGFRLAYPRIQLEIQLTDALIDVIDADCDLAIRISRPPTDKSTIWRKLCDVPRHAVAAPALLQRMARPEEPGDLSAEHTMSYSADGGSETWEFSRGTTVRQHRAGTWVTTNNGDLLAGLATAGQGVCVLPEFLLARGLAAGELEVLLPDWTLPQLWLTLFYPPYETLPPLVATFSDYFESYIEGARGLGA
ncbi:MAG: LysR family transcriptional regulator [Pseudomonadota bacterium]